MCFKVNKTNTSQHTNNLNNTNISRKIHTRGIVLTLLLFVLLLARLDGTSTPKPKRMRVTDAEVTETSPTAGSERGAIQAMAEVTEREAGAGVKERKVALRTAPQSPAGPAAAALKDLSLELACSYCFYLLLEPVVLPCGHTYCAECISDWRAERNVCPCCSKPISAEPCRVLVLENAIVELLKTLPPQVSRFSFPLSPEFAASTLLTIG